MKAPNVTAGDWQIVIGLDVTGYPTFALCGLSGDEKRDPDVLAANACLMQASKQLAEALASLLEIHPLASETPNEAFERIGSHFMRDTGMLRPGKGDRSGIASEERERAFSVWWSEKISRSIEALKQAGYE